MGRKKVNPANYLAVKQAEQSDTDSLWIRFILILIQASKQPETEFLYQAFL